MIDIQQVARNVMKSGPDRVVINADGDATTCQIARVGHGITPDVIFIRNDGWTLGAPPQFERVAERLWRNEWVGIMRRPEITATAYPVKG